MKKLLPILSLLASHIMCAQFAVVRGEAGEMAIHYDADANSRVIDTLNNGEIVFCLESDDGWHPVDYDFDNGKTGFIEESGVALIENFRKIPRKEISDTAVVFEGSSIQVSITKKAFDANANKLEYSNDGTKFLKKINGREIWGTDGNVPKMQYGEVVVQGSGKKIVLPAECLFEPNLENTMVSLDAEKNTVYIWAYNSDGAGGYAVLWIIQNRKFKKRIVTVGA